MIEASWLKSKGLGRVKNRTSERVRDSSGSNSNCFHSSSIRSEKGVLSSIKCEYQLKLSD